MKIPNKKNGHITITEAIIQEILRTADKVGAWWLTVLFLVFIAWMEQLLYGLDVYFFIHFTYAIVLSMILSSPINGMLSFHLNEALFKKDYKEVLNSLTGALLLVMPMIFSIALLLFVSVSLKPFSHGLIFAALTTGLGALWIINNIMMILQLKRMIFFIYLLVLGLTFILILFTRYFFEIEYVLVLLIFGFSGIAFIQYGYIVKKYHRNERLSASFSFFKKDGLPVLLFFLFFNLGIWIDKILFWFMPQTTYPVDPLFRYSDYDYPFFVAFTILSLAQLLTLIRVNEYIKKPHKEFSEGLFHNFPLSMLDKGKIEIILGYRKIFYVLSFIYGALIMMIMLVVSLGLIELPWANPGVFQMLLIAILFLSLFSLNMLVLNYMNQNKLLAWLCFLFFLLNGLLTFLGIQLNIPYDGFGLLLSSMVVFFISYHFVEKILGHWEYVIIKEIINDF